MQCPRCAAPAEGAYCQSCGESLAFAPPRVGTEADAPPATPFEPPGGFGWLAAAGIIQILLGALWLVSAVVIALIPPAGVIDRIRESYPELQPNMLHTLMTG